MIRNSRNYYFINAYKPSLADLKKRLNRETLMDNIHKAFFFLILIIFLLWGSFGSLTNDCFADSTSKAPIDDSLKTQILILGTPHLQLLGESFKPSLLDSLLHVLQYYKPDLIGVESMPPYLIDDMERKGGNFTEVLNQFAKEIIEYGHISQNLLNTSRKGAEDKTDSLLQVIVVQTKKGVDDIRLQLVLYMIASYDLNSAILQWTYLPESLRTTNDVIPENISKFLNNKLKEPSEITFIGIELAKRIEIQEIESIDDHQDKDVFLKIAPKLLEELKDNPIYESVAKSSFYVDSEKRQQEAVQKGDLLPYYLYLNSLEYTSKDIENQWYLFFRTKLTSGLDRSRIALWEVRNLNIASHIRSALVLHPKKRMLVIIGTAHKPFIEEYLSQMMDVKLLKLDALLVEDN